MPKNIGSTEKLPPFAYWASTGRFNLTALLQTGRFYLDESGLLVAPNGTRYRIPSGPPEGRKPLRPDRPTVNRPEVVTLKGDLFSSEQQDSSKLGYWSLTKSPKFHDDSRQSDALFSGKLTVNIWNHSKTNLGKPDLLEIGGNTGPIEMVTNQLDWNVILLTVILSSIALVCNLALVIFFAWKISRFRVTSPSHIHYVSPQKGHSNPLITLPPNSKESNSPERYRSLRNRVSSSADPTRLIKPTYESKSGTYATHMLDRDPRSFHTRFSRRYRHRRGRRRRPTAVRHHGPSFQERDPLVGERISLHRDPKSRILHTDMSLLGDLGPAAPFLNTMDRVEIGSSSGGSWQVVVSDGMVSETTADEEDDGDGNTTTGGDSGTNSAILHRDRQQIALSKTSDSRQKFIRSDSTPDDIGRRTELGLMVTSVDGHRLMRTDTKRIRLDTIRSDHLPQSEGATSASNSDSFCSTSQRQSQTVFLNDFRTTGTIQVCHSLGIHFGFLGLVLSLIQLIVVCSALSRRMFDSTSSNLSNAPRTESYLSELLCVMATSLAADTLLCARQYVLGAILFVFWTSWFMSIFGPIARGNNQTTMSSFCLFKQNGLEEREEWNCATDSSRRQQGYAYLTLTHSLPWALAAGTALLITFGLPSNVDDIAISFRGQIELNLFFHGLHSLLICQADPRHSSRMPNQTPDPVIVNDRTSLVTRNVSINSMAVPIASQHSLSWSLLILIPLCIHVSMCLIFAIMIRLRMQRTREVKYMTHYTTVTSRIVFCVSGALLTLISLEYLSCAVPVIWSMFTLTRSAVGGAEQTRSSPYVHRLILFHLLMDPWLVTFLIRPVMEQMMAHLNQSTDSDRQPHSELSLRPWMNHLRVRKKPRNNIYHPGEIGTNRRHVPSSVGLMGCLPLSNRISTTDSRALTVPTDGQTMLMSCVPSTNFYVSPIQTLPHSTGLDTGLFVPLDDHAVRLTPSQSDAIAMDRYHLGQASLSMPMNFAKPTHSLALRTMTSGQPNSSLEFNTNIFPQLCEHHQKLLEEHYAVRLPGLDNPTGPASTAAIITTDNSTSKMVATTSYTGQLRAFGQVPRINPASLKYTDSLLMKPVIRHTSEDSCVVSVSAPESSTDPHLVHRNYPPVERHSPSSDDPSKFLPGRPPGGQSQATAAVMAAAAAAVAAQAGTISRSNVKHTGTVTPASTNSQLSPSQQPCKQEIINELKNPLLHSSLSSSEQCDPSISLQ
ncbi:hypothetical protein D915_001652 [Fasciola hepatica]|uniref:Uncharacterized protein n=1 Tax=Fasciola hepatica TaxID=6192 RepID=A0A4E0RJ57_FASHE|nr:hypothetical protein D915_001652 [Fasciola hepatica]